MAGLLAGLPVSVAGETVNRLCASGMAAAIHASRAIQTDSGDVFIAGGVEHMTRGPWVISKTSKAFGRDAQMHDSSFGWRFVNSKLHDSYGTDGMGVTAENLVEKYNINRESQDLFALWSQQKTAKAQNAGFFNDEILPVEIARRKLEPLVFNKDEFSRANSSLESLAALRPAFKKDGSVTAGNSSGLNDGAAALLIASESAIKSQGFKPMARIVSSAVAGGEPRMKLFPHKF